MIYIGLVVQLTLAHRKTRLWKIYNETERQFTRIAFDCNDLKNVVDVYLKFSEEFINDNKKRKVRNKLVSHLTLYTVDYDDTTTIFEVFF